MAEGGDCPSATTRIKFVDDEERLLLERERGSYVSLPPLQAAETDLKRGVGRSEDDRTGSSVAVEMVPTPRLIATRSLPPVAPECSDDEDQTHVRCWLSRQFPAPPKSPGITDRVVVYVWVVFCKLGDIDCVKESFTADVFVQARWREPRLDGKRNIGDTEGTNGWSPKLYIENSVGETKEKLWRIVMWDPSQRAFVYERRKIKGTFSANMNLKDFPFDTQDITMNIVSELSTDKVDLWPDLYERTGVKITSLGNTQEWEVHLNLDNARAVVDKVMDGENEAHPTISFKCHVSRRLGFYVLNLYLVMFFISCMSFATFCMDFKLTASRLGCTMIILLALLTFKSTVSRHLPRISYLTFVDCYVLSSVLLIGAVGMWHAIVNVIPVEADMRSYIDTCVLITLGSLHFLVQILLVLVILCWVLAERRKHQREDKQYLAHLRAVAEALSPLDFNLS